MVFWEVLIVLGFVLLIVSGWRLWRAFRQKKPKKPVLLIAVGSLLLMAAGGSQVPVEAAYLKISPQQLETDPSGNCHLEGTTNSEAELFIDGEEISHEGTFTYDIQLVDDGTKELVIKSVFRGEETVKTIEITPSTGYLAHLESQAEKERLKLADTALATAEKEPSQDHFDVAFTQIQALSQSYPELEQRLEDVADYLEILGSLEELEQEPTREGLVAIQTQVAASPLAKDALTKRVAACEKQVHEQEKNTKLVAAAKEKIKHAETTLANDDYQSALEALTTLPTKQPTLEKRLQNLHHAIEEKQAAEKAQDDAEKKAAQEKEAQEKAAQEKAAEEQRQQEIQAAQEQEQIQQQAQEQQAQDQQTTQEAAVGQTVMVTPTGSKYHTHKCGNGNFTPATLEEALARNLTPCSKCF